LVGVAVKVTTVQAQLALFLEDIVITTLGVTTGLTTMGITLLVTVRVLAQGELLIITQVTVLVFESVVDV
jgi:hypothetical protein